MPLDVLTTADNVRIQGSLTVINDPQGNAGNVNIVGSVTASGSLVAASNLTVSGSLAALSGISLTSGLQFDQVVGGPATATTISQLLSAASSTITMTGSGRVIFLNPTATQATVLLTPTSSAAATAATFTNGTEILLVNLHPSSATTITIPTSSAGPNNGSVITISGGNSAKLIYVAALQSWIHIV